MRTVNANKPGDIPWAEILSRVAVAYEEMRGEKQST